MSEAVRTPRIPSLDGVRALSIGLVLVGHTFQKSTGSSPSSFPWNVLGNGSLGVEIFFLISGYLITRLLLTEFDQSHRISLSKFYVRRVFRIFPALYAYCAVLFLLVKVRLLHVSLGSFVSALTFTTNYSPYADAEALAHIWSLSIEEQFYLLWPACLSLLLRLKDRRFVVRCVIMLILLAPLLRVGTHVWGSDFLASRLYVSLHTRMDALMFGCLIALLEGAKSFESFYAKYGRYSIVCAGAVLVVSPLMTHAFGGRYVYLIGYTLEGVVFSLAILWLVRNPATTLGRMFNGPAVVHVGVLSYSIYLWQQLFISTSLIPSKCVIASLLLTICFAQVSYRFVEKPFLRLRQRLENMRTPLF